MFEDYDTCNNKDVVDDPNEWATKMVTENPTFVVWDSDQKMIAAANAADKIEKVCKKKCGSNWRNC